MEEKENHRRLGYLYEALFNIGLLKALKQKLDFYPRWLEEWKDYSLRDYALDIACEGGITHLLKNSLSRVMFIYLLQGYTFGKSLLEDWETLKGIKPNLFFYYGKPIPVEDDKNFFFQRFEEKFGNIEGATDRKGALIHTDIILHLTAGENFHYIVVADLSLSKAGRLLDGYKFLNREDFFQAGINRIYQADLEAVAQGYLFKPINLKDGGNFKRLLDSFLELKNSQTARELFSLLKWKNGEVAKLIQACSYAGEYLKFLQKRGIIDESTPLVVRVFGITLHKVAQISFSPKVDFSEVLNLLEKAGKVYTSFRATDFDKERFGEEFFKKLLHFFSHLKAPTEGVKIHFAPLSSGSESHLVFREIWNFSEEYRLNLKKRKTHEEVFKEVLKDSRWVANLGVPGIGKTTTLFKIFGKKSLIIYTSPRNYLNNQLLKKWCGTNPNRVAFYTEGEPSDTVFYLSGDKHFSLPEELIVPQLGKVKLQKLDQTAEDENYRSTLREVTHNLSSDRGEKKAGVLNRLLKTVTYLLEEKDKPLKGKEILVAFSTQAVLKRKDGGSTFEHIKRFFLGQVGNPAFGGEVIKVLKERFISNGIRSVVFVMDEITGSETGRYLFRQFIKERWFQTLQEVAQERLGLKLYFILLDASLKGVKLFKTFAEDNDERPVIYIDIQNELSPSKDIQIAPVEIGGVPFTVLDAVGFPAAQLEIYYDFHPFKDPERQMVSRLVSFIDSLFNRGSEQIFLFLQDKKLIEKIKERLIREGTLKGEEIEVIHSLSGKERDSNLQKVKLILATSSASRGVTFPLVDTYIVVFPDFEVEENLTELVQVLFRGRDRLGERSLEDHRRKVFLLFPLVRDKKGEISLQQRVKSLELATLLKLSLLTISCGGAWAQTSKGAKCIKVVPVGVQREKIFHPLKELDNRISSPKRVLRQIQKLSKDKIRDKALILGEALNDFLQEASLNLPYSGLTSLLKLLKEAESCATVEDFLKIDLPDGKIWEFLTVKGHNLILAFPLLRTEFVVDSKGKKDMLRLLREIEEGAPSVSPGLKPLKDFLKDGKEMHTDLKPTQTDRILIIPPLVWEYENFDPTEVIHLNISRYLRKLLKHFVGGYGNFYPEAGSIAERPFGVTDLDKHLFDEVNKDFLKSGNLVFSSEVNLLEMLL
jgi:hypothetical protein